jgi:hypothetical protein
MPIAGIGGLVATVLTGWPNTNASRLTSAVRRPVILGALDLGIVQAVAIGIAAMFGWALTIQRTLGTGPRLIRGGPTVRATPTGSPSAGAASSRSGRSMAESSSARPTAHQARVARRAFDPADKATVGGTTPLLVDPCRTSSLRQIISGGQRLQTPPSAFPPC